jgi:hypothetical protein
MKEKSSIQLSLKVAPWKAFLFRKYAEHYGFSLRSAFSDAINCLAEASMSKEMIRKWAKEYRKAKSRKENEVD